MRYPFFQLNAFSSSPFGGNPACVCLVFEWPESDLMRRIAKDNDKTVAFVRLAGDIGDVRFYLPIGELPFVGHAALAAARVMLARVWTDASSVELVSAGGTFRAERVGASSVAITLPAVAPRPVDLADRLAAALGAPVAEAWASNSHYFARLENAAAVRALKPDLQRIMAFDMDSIVATAEGEGSASFVSRAFAPKEGLPEDPVCGSAHLTLVPYWSAQLGTRRHHARQLSERGGDLACELDDEGTTVRIAGDCALYIEGTITT